VSPVLELFGEGIPDGWWKVRRQTLDGLDSGALIKTEQMLGRLEVQSNDVVHFRKKLWVGDLQKILSEMGPQSVFCKHTRNSRTAHSTSDHLRMGGEVPLGIPKRPPRTPGQHRILTEKRNGLQSRLFAEQYRMTATRPIGDGLSSPDSHYPSAHRPKMTVGKPGYLTRMDRCPV